MSATDWRVEPGDCVESMAAMPAASVDAIVTDPPYGLGFMGKEWDSTFEAADVPMRRNAAQDAVNAGAARQGGRQRAGVDYQRRMARDSRAFQAWCEAWAAEALRVLKPGGHMLAFGGTRTYHRLTCAIEDAGFEIRDTIAWLYGSGFPKSLDVGKAIDKAAGAEREVRGVSPHAASRVAPEGYDGWTGHDTRTITAPATPDAERWDGWGTALKPAHEPIVVARKPLAGTVAGNVQAHGTGALNVDGCRVGTTKETPASPSGVGSYGGNPYGQAPTASGMDANTGRWPANVALDPEAAAILDTQTGELTSGSLLPGHRQGQGTHTHEGGYVGGGVVERAYGGDTGGASRFFYVAKASSAERNAGLDGFEERGTTADGYGSIQTPKLDRAAPRENWTPHPVKNSHPTVKPVQLMRWLCRLVTPPGGLILDPFTGSGTTGCAAVLEGFRFVGIEREQEYARIAEARIGWWADHPEGVELVARLEAERERRDVADAGQTALFG